MIDLGADVDARDSAGDTALHLAARQSADGSAWHLMRVVANCCANNRAGCNPYDIAHGYDEDWATGSHVEGVWTCNIPRGILFSEVGPTLDFRALHDVRVSEEHCHGYMAILTIGGQEMLVCCEPWCLDMRKLSVGAVEDKVEQTFRSSCGSP